MEAIMKSFIVKMNYERTSTIRKSNIKRRLTVINRLKDQNIPYELNMGLFRVEYIPDNIKRLITQIGE